MTDKRHIISITESFAGTIPLAQTRLAIEAQLKTGRRQANKRAIRTLKALGIIPSEWKNPSVGLITNNLGDRFIIAIPEPETTVEE